MDEERRSVTAESAAVMRALHQKVDGEPKVLDDPITQLPNYLCYRCSFLPFLQNLEEVITSNKGRQPRAIRGSLSEVP